MLYVICYITHKRKKQTPETCNSHARSCYGLKSTDGIFQRNISTGFALTLFRFNKNTSKSKGNS